MRFEQLCKIVHGQRRFTDSCVCRFQLRGQNQFGKVDLQVNSVRKISVTAGGHGAHPAGLVALWSGEGNADDSIGSCNGELVGSIGFTDGKVGRAFSFNDKNSYVSIPNSPLLDKLTDSITIALWIKVNHLTANQDWEGIVTKGNSGWRLMATTYDKTIYFAAPGMTTDITGTRNVNDGQWHHVAVVYDGASLFLYVDGTLDISKPASGSISQINHPVWLGYNVNENNGVTYPFDGLVDEASIYNRALSDAEIQAQYEAGNKN